MDTVTYDHMQRIIGATINKLNIPPHVRDEAESEAWVILAAALDNHNESFGVPLAAHVALRLRWGLKTWMGKSIRDSEGTIQLAFRDGASAGTDFGAEAANGEYGRLPIEPFDPDSLRDYDHEAECAVLLATVLDLCDTVLTTKERICILGTAIGLYPAEVSRLAKVNGKGIKANVASARDKLKIALKMRDERGLLLLTDKV